MFSLSPLAITAIGTSVAVAFIMRGARSSISLWALVLSLLLFKLIEVNVAFSAFSSEAFLTIVFLLFLSRGLDRSGLISRVLNTILRKVKTVKLAVFWSIIITSIFSAFMNNTLLVALLIKPLRNFSAKKRFPVSYFMIPLSYAAIFGGLLTIVGTSTNLVILGVAKNYIPDLSFHFWQPAIVAFPAILLLAAAFALLMPKLIRVTQSSAETLGKTHEYAVEFIVLKNSELIGLSIEENGLRHLEGGYLAEVYRGEQSIVGPEPSFVIQAEDQLVFVGSPETLANLKDYRGLAPAQLTKFSLTDAESNDFYEAVVSKRGFLDGVTPKEINFRDKFGAVILGVLRDGERIRGKIGKLKLQGGDLLLLESKRNLIEAWARSRSFYFVTKVKQSDPTIPGTWKRAALVMMITIFLLSSGFVSTLSAGIIGTFLLLLLNCTSYEDLIDNMDMETLLTISASLALGNAWKEAGIENFVAHIDWGLFDNPFSLFVVVYVIGMILTEFLSNNATGVILTSAFLPLALQQGYAPTPFIVGIMLSSSASFLTGFGYQTNLMVMGPGGYKASDFIKPGLLAHLILFSVSLLYAYLVF